MDDLPELRDIHLPEPIGLFPLGYGFISSVCILIFAALVFFFWRKAYLKSKKHYALQSIKNLNDATIDNICQISQMLRRICKIKHKKAVALYGKDWSSFLNQTGSFALDSKSLQILTDAPYALPQTTVAKQNFEQIKNFAVSWVEANL
ncbi:MAG: DUF4381 domain-containing protein [Alphaproteobacteria bacterium]|nr:DUF4381 domain-containing protein [Alphaproteobacteria bacterium]